METTTTWADLEPGDVLFYVGLDVLHMLIVCDRPFDAPASLRTMALCLSELYWNNEYVEIHTDYRLIDPATWKIFKVSHA